MVCLLKKSLYGLKQSPRQWNKKFDECMFKLGFHRSAYDRCIYFKCSTVEGMIYLLLYVDDMLPAGKSLSEIIQVKQSLMREFGD